MAACVVSLNATSCSFAIALVWYEQRQQNRRFARAVAEGPGFVGRIVEFLCGGDPSFAINEASAFGIGCASLPLAPAVIRRFQEREGTTSVRRISEKSREDGIASRV